MRMAITQGIQGLLMLSGFVALAMAGVKLHIDKRLESFFIEVEPDADRAVVRLLSQVADDLGFEVMPEWECEPQVLDNGAIRHWMAEKEALHDSSLVQAV